jgi:hypothetical protein
VAPAIELLGIQTFPPLPPPLRGGQLIGMIVLKKSASGAEIIGGWSALKAADWLRQVAAALSSG